MMKAKNIIPDAYFEEEDFLIEESDESKILGVLGSGPSPEQYLKFELCRFISQAIQAKSYSNSEAGKVLGLDPSDVSRLLNLHIDRFTIERLIKICCCLENSKNVWKRVAKISLAIEKRMAS